MLEVSVSSHYLPSVHLTRYDYEWEWIGTPSPPLHFLRYCQKEQTDGWKMLGGGLLGINEYGVSRGEEREGQAVTSVNADEKCGCSGIHSTVTTVMERG